VASPAEARSTTLGGAPAAPSGTPSVVPVAPLASAVAVVALGPGQYGVTARSPIALSRRVQVQTRSSDGAWHAVEPGGALDWSTGCAPPEPAAPPCVELAAEHAQILPAWSGLACGADPAPSPRPPTTPIAAGPLRVVVQACDGDPTHWPSEPTELPASLGALERARAGSALVRGIVAGANPGDFSEPGLEVSGRIADLAVIPGVEANLSAAALDGLGRWLRSPEGFDEAVARRCKRANAFGFRLWRQVPPFASQVTELTVDFHCHSLVVVNQVGREREVSGAYFDALRGDLLALVRGALPEAAATIPP
jgi:hypothetical protein